MSINGNDNDIIEKKDLINQKLSKTRYIDLEFSHKSSGGETFINFSSLITPPEYTSLDGFTNPSPSSLIESQIRLNKANVELSSTGERGKLFHREDYIIKSNGGIHLLYETVENEIISGVIRSVVRNQPALVDASKIVKTGTLAEGATTFVIGNSFKLFDNPSEQVGAIVVMRFKGEETPQMMFRNEGNLPNGIGNYYEVDGGNNLCNTIEFNEAGQVGGENIVVYSYALQVGKPSESYLAELETLGGQVDTISSFLTDIHDLGSNIFQTVANQIDLASFGSKVVNLEKIFNLEISQPIVYSLFTASTLTSGNSILPDLFTTPYLKNGLIEDYLNSNTTTNRLEIKKDCEISISVSAIGASSNSLTIGYNGNTLCITQTSSNNLWVEGVFTLQVSAGDYFEFTVGSASSNRRWTIMTNDENMKKIKDLI